MSRTHLTTVAALAAIVVLAFMASATSAGTVQSQRATAAATSTQIGAVSVRLRINRFVRRGGHLYAVGTTTAKFAPTVASAATYPSAVAQKRFVVRVKSIRGFASAQRICPVLDLTLGPLDLNLLGLMVHLDQVHLTITADSNGGLLGQLLCSLAGHGPNHAKAAKSLTRAAHRSGLSTRGLRLMVPLYQTTSANGSTGLGTGQGSISPMMICPILDLTLGPLDLNLLGLMVHLDTVHLVITADSEGGLLGQLLSGLLCGGGGGAPAGARSS
jgi:hypothetical protein